MNLKKAKKLRRMVYRGTSSRPGSRVFAQTNKRKRTFSLSDIAKFAEAKMEVNKSFITSTKVSVKLRAQYQRLKSKVLDVSEKNPGVPVKQLSQPAVGKLRTKTQKNQDKRARKQLLALV